MDPYSRRCDNCTEEAKCRARFVGCSGSRLKTIMSPYEYNKLSSMTPSERAEKYGPGQYIGDLDAMAYMQAVVTGKRAQRVSRSDNSTAPLKAKKKDINLNPSIDDLYDFFDLSKDYGLFSRRQYDSASSGATSLRHSGSFAESSWTDSLGIFLGALFPAVVTAFVGFVRIQLL